MESRSIAKFLFVAAASLAIVFATTSINAPRASAGEDDTDSRLDSRIKIGLEIAPVPLNFARRNRALVGLGSYIVNAVGDCNGCHNGGAPPNLTFEAGGNPYFRQTAKVDPTVYLSGGSDFGPVGTPTGPNMYPGPDMIARNLTPNKYGVPEGGMSLSEFKDIMRHGTDFDHIHPTCTLTEIKAIHEGLFPVCIPTSPGNTPDGDLLQVMPWPTFSHMTDKDIEAVYEYLSAIPCIDNTTSLPPAGAPNELRNDCGNGYVANRGVRDSSMPQRLASRPHR